MGDMAPQKHFAPLQIADEDKEDLDPGGWMSEKETIRNSCRDLLKSKFCYRTVAPVKVKVR